MHNKPIRTGDRSRPEGETNYPAAYGRELLNEPTLTKKQQEIQRPTTRRHRHRHARKQPTKRGRWRWPWAWAVAAPQSRSTSWWPCAPRSRSMRRSTWTKRSTRQGMAMAPWCLKPYSRSASSSSAPKSGCLRWSSGTAKRRCSSPSAPTRTVTHPLGATISALCCCCCCCLRCIGGGEDRRRVVEEGGGGGREIGMRGLG
ncbi:hypothetical protein VPH35_002292 [Triticum aestivum]